MKKKEYAKYLSEIIGKEIEIDAIDLPCQFYGYFQSFMPNGIGLSKVFEPIENGALYFERLIEIYKATAQKFDELSAKGLSPGYFCPIPQKNQKSLILNGQQYISNLKSFAEIINNKEFIKTLARIKSVEIINSSERNNTNDTTIIIYEAISDWFIDNTDFDSTVEILSEAFYSISCDYNLSYYLQYPRYENKLQIDLFKPYFEIWKSGFHCWFDEEKLIIGK